MEPSVMESTTQMVWNVSVLFDEELDCTPSDLSFFNLSHYYFPATNNATLQTPLQKGLKVGFYVLAIAFALLGNAVVMATVLINRSMRTTINCYLVNLAVADLLICVICMWVQVVNYLTKPMYVLGTVICKISSFAQMTCLTASVLTLTAISFDRLIAILFPFHVRITKQRTGSVIAAVWVVSAAIACPFLIYRKHYELQFRDKLQYLCEESWPQVSHYDPVQHTCLKTHPYKVLYYTAVTITLFFLPVAIMSTAYILIIRTLWKSEVPGERNALTDVAQSRARRKVIKMVVVVLLAFVLCWMPLQVIVLYSLYGHSSSQDGQLPEWFNDVSFSATFVAYANSALNPLIYGGLNHNFRQSMCALLKCACRKQPFNRPLGSQRSRSTISTAVHWSPNNQGRTRVSNGRGMKMSTMAHKDPETTLSYARDSL